MRLVRLALVNLNTTVGAAKSNVDRAMPLARAAAADGATIIVLPEQTIGGYMQEDLVQWRSFVDAQWMELDRLATETASLDAAIAVGCTVAHGMHVYSAAALVHRGKILGVVPKEKLPTYNVFYEGRTLSRGRAGMSGELASPKGRVPFGDMIFDFDFGSVAVEVCEDAWSPDGPMRRRCFAGAEIVLNLSASPFRVGVTETRREMIATRSADNECAIVYANLVGGNDGLIFDGGGYVAQNGRMLVDAPRFREGFSITTLDLDRTRRLRLENTTWRTDQQSMLASEVRHVPALPPMPSREKLVYPSPAGASFFLPAHETPARSHRVSFCEDLLDALSLGLGDYFEKTGAFKKIGVALSGGRDSLLSLFIAHRYVARRFEKDPQKSAKFSEILRAFYMPSQFSSAETRAAAEQTAKELGVPLVISSIDDAFERETIATHAMLQPGEELTALAKQNIQARIRAERMWTWANSASGLFVQTSNMSEKSVGYTTIGGDMEGALSVIANLPKTVVNYLLDYLLEMTGSEAIKLTLVMPATAELAADQEDEKDLMPFPILDACFALYAGEKMDVAEVKIALRAIFPGEDAKKLDGFAEKFGRLFTQSIYKWVQSPLALHVGNLDLDRERALQLPVVQKNDW
ncbi:MAG: NAD(+) synthase [Polyangiaceae bacterium]